MHLLYHRDGLQHSRHLKTIHARWVSCFPLFPLARVQAPTWQHPSAHFSSQHVDPMALSRQKVDSPEDVNEFRSGSIWKISETDMPCESHQKKTLWQLNIASRLEAIALCSLMLRGTSDLPCIGAGEFSGHSCSAHFTCRSFSHISSWTPEQLSPCLPQRPTVSNPRRASLVPGAGTGLLNVWTWLDSA